MGKQQIHVWISGRVQGVFFRQTTQEEASRRGLDGWVRNLPDGRVEALFQGDEASLQDMIRWCRQGPSGAWVEVVESIQEEPVSNLSGFRIRYA